MKKLVMILLFAMIISLGTANAQAQTSLSAPGLGNNPALDIIVTNARPLLSFFNSTGGKGGRTYTIQVDISPTFDSKSLFEYRNVQEKTKYISEKLVDKKNALKDLTTYYWRVRATDADGNTGPWASSRFHVDLGSDDAFMGVVRAPVAGVWASSGQNPNNLIDWDDSGQVSFWQACPPGQPEPWVAFSFDHARYLSKIWMLSNFSGLSGRLKDFTWEASLDGSNWEKIVQVKGNDTYRNIIDFKPVKARFIRLRISAWHGYAPQLNVVIPYSPGHPPIPDTPEGKYVLIVGNQMDGFTFSELAEKVRALNLGLETLTVPHYEVSLELLSRLDHKPVAIILSGNNADYPHLPMFEYNGEFEIIRQTDIPILGICAGHQLMVMAQGYTYARSMGWSDITSLEYEKAEKMTEIKIKRKDPVFQGIPDPFTAPEIHGWEVVVLPKNFEVLAASSYIQAYRSKSGLRYGEQFHAEINAPYNQGAPYLLNFLKMALKKVK